MILDLAIISQCDTKSTGNKKIDKLDFIKIKNFEAAKDTIKGKVGNRRGKNILQVICLIRD